MLSPLDYCDDCHALLGRVLSHDDQMADVSLASAFESTKARWHEAHGTPYVWRPAPVDGRGNGSGYSGCGSCGWGGEDFHTSLDHVKAEQEQIGEAYAGSAGYGDDALATGGVMDITATDGAVGEQLDGGMPEPVPWATDSPMSAHVSNADASGADDIMSDPWAAPPDSSSSDDGGSWGWGGDSGGDGGGDGGGCGGGCGGD